MAAAGAGLTDRRRARPATGAPWPRAPGRVGPALPLARERGLTHVEITTDPENLGSQKVILDNGGVLVGTFDKGAAYGHAPGLRYRIELGP